MHRTQEQWISLFTKLGAFWRHNGNPKHPHALLTKGGHSNGFFNWSKAAQHPLIAREVAEDIIQKLFEEINFAEMQKIQRVITPGNGAITLGDRLAEEICLKANEDCQSGFTEKNEGSMLLSRFSCNGEIVLAGEDTITTAASVIATIDEIERSGGTVPDYIVAVCNRSGKTKVGGRTIISLIEVPMDNWSPEECPLCKKGSEPIRPKKENWLRLTHPE